MKHKLVNWYDNNYKIITVILLLFALISISFITIRAGYDYWWHIKAGEYIFKTGSVPITGIFSWFGTINNLPWISHEWLSELVIYIYKIIFGQTHIIWYCLINIGILFTCLFLFNKKSYLKNLPRTLIFLFLGVLLIFPSLSPRPHLISYILLACSLYLLFDLYKHPSSKKIYFLPLITILNANFHGGSSNLPYILCFMFALIGLFKFKLGNLESTKLSALQLKKYCLIGILSILAILINPHGIELLIYPFSNIQDTLMKGLILEWTPLSITNLSHLPITIFITYLIITIVTTKKQISLLNVSLVAVFIVLTISSIRFAPLLWIVSSFTIFDLFEEKPIPKKIWVILSASFIILGTGCFIKEGSNVLNRINTGLLKPEIITCLKESNPQRLYNYYDYGGYLIYNDILVFIDGRADIYSKYNLKDAIALSFLKGEYQYIIDNYNFDYFVIPSNLPLAAYLKNNSNYQLILEIDNTIIYKKRTY